MYFLDKNKKKPSKANASTPKPTIVKASSTQLPLPEKPSEPEVIKAAPPVNATEKACDIADIWNLLFGWGSSGSAEPESRGPFIPHESSLPPSAPVPKAAAPSRAVPVAPRFAKGLKKDACSTNNKESDSKNKHTEKTTDKHTHGGDSKHGSAKVG